MTFGAEKFLKRKLRDSTHPKLHPGQLDLYQNISPSRAFLWRYGSFSSYAMDHLFNSLLFTQSEGISGCKNYLCFVHLSRNEIIISRASLCNVMVTRPTSHMISTRDHSYDLLIWSRHVTTYIICSNDLNMWTINIILTSSH